MVIIVIFPRITATTFDTTITTITIITIILQVILHIKATGIHIAFDQITAATGDPDGLAAGLGFVLSVAFSMNLLLFVLNMFPISPFDGGTALTLLVPESMLDGYYAVIRHPIVAIGGLIVVFTQFGTMFRPLLFGAIGWLYPGVTYG